MIDLKDLCNNYTMVAKRYNTSTIQVIKYFDSFVNVHILRLPTNLGIED